MTKPSERGWVDLSYCHRRDLDLEKKRLRTPSTIALCNYIGKLTARIDREFFVSIVLACAYDNVSPSLSMGEINVASHDASCGKNGNADVADGGNLTI